MSFSGIVDEGNAFGDFEDKVNLVLNGNLLNPNGFVLELLVDFSEHHVSLFFIALDDGSESNWHILVADGNSDCAVLAHELSIVVNRKEGSSESLVWEGLVDNIDKGGGVKHSYWNGQYDAMMKLRISSRNEPELYKVSADGNKRETPYRWDYRSANEWPDGFPWRRYSEA